MLHALPACQGGGIGARRESSAELRAVSPCCAALCVLPPQLPGAWRCPQMWSARQAGLGRPVGTCIPQLCASASQSPRHVSATRHRSQAWSAKSAQRVMLWPASGIALMHALSSHRTYRSARLMGGEHALHLACVGRSCTGAVVQSGLPLIGRCCPPGLTGHQRTPACM